MSAMKIAKPRAISSGRSPGPDEKLVSHKLRLVEKLPSFSPLRSGGIVPISLHFPSLAGFEVALLGFRPEGAATCQPRATPWDLENVMTRALKGPNMVFNPSGTALHFPLRQGACPCHALSGLC